MKINNMTEAQLIEFHNAMGLAFDVKFVNINTDVAQSVINFIVNNLPFKIPIDIDLRPMCFRNIIALNYEPGNTSERSPLNQIECVVHEIQHTVEIRKVEPNIRWYVEYFSPDSKFRANQELMARKAEFELIYWYGGIVPALDLSTGYLLSRSSLKLAEDSYKNHVEDVKRLGTSDAGLHGRGACYMDSSRVAIEILDGMGVVPV